MDCLYTTSLNDEDLLQYVFDEGPLPTEIKEHIELCESCQQRLAMLKGVNASLVGNLYRSQCPSVTQLARYFSLVLEAGERVVVSEHVQKCPLCASELDEMYCAIVGCAAPPELSTTEKELFFL